jgi:aspartate aminotransferase-like enzyme
MLNQKRFLMIPGPTPVPESVLIELAKHPLPHRSPEFSKILLECTEGLKEVAQTKLAIPFIFAASGTGTMESVLVNLLTAGDHILAVNNGVFGKRWADMAALFGAKVDRIDCALGSAVKLEQVREALDKDQDKKIKLVLLTFSETSTGIANPIKEIAELVHNHNNEIVVAIDAITGLGAMPLKMDEWGFDVIISGSQKGFMIPPGLAFAWVGERAWKLHEKSQFPRFYWDWTKAKNSLLKDKTTPFTPNVSFICALKEALNLMLAEGITNTWARHERLKQTTRQSIKAMGLELLTSDSEASAAITSIKAPNGLEIKDIRQKLKSDWQIIVADGQGELQGKIFRIGHLGFVSDRDILTGLSALAEVLHSLNFPLNPNWIEAYRKALI